jgi:hypothetical protein
MSTKAEIRGSSTSREETVDADSGRIKARRLLCEILPQNALHEFLSLGFFHYEGKHGVYRIRPDSQTEIYRHGRLAATACLNLTVFAPSFDRMMTEYLILKSDEALYWNKANIFPARNRFLSPTVLLITALNLALAVKLILDYVLVH